MDIHIHRIEPGSHMNDTAGEFSHHLLVGIGLFHRRRQHGGLDMAAIDKEKLGAAAAATAGGQRDKTSGRHLLAGTADRDHPQGDVPAQHGVQGGFQLTVSRSEQFLLAVPNKF